MKWLIKPVWRTLAFTLTPLLVLLVVVLLLIGTTPGARWLVEQVRDDLPEGMRIGNVDGRLLGSLRVADVQYRDAQDLQVSIGSLEIDWRPWNLLLGELTVTSLSVDGVRVYLPEAEEKPPGLTLPELRAPLRIRVSNATVTGVDIFTPDHTRIDTLQFAARWRGAQLELNNLIVQAPQGELRTEGELRLAEDYPIDLRVQWQVQQDDTRWQGEGMVSGNLRGMQLHQQVRAPQIVNLEGTLGVPADAAPVFDLVARWDSLQWPPQGKPQVTSHQGQAQLQGSADDYRIELTQRLELPERPALQTKLQAQGDAAGLRISDSVIEALDGRVVVNGELHWQPELNWQAQVVADGLQAQALWPERHGELNASLHIGGQRTADGLQAIVRIESVSGHWQDRPVQGQGLIHIDNDNYRIEDVQLSSGDARLTLDGMLRDSWQLNWRLDVPDVSALDPHGMGRLAANGSMSGPRAKPIVRAQLEGSALGFKAQRARTLQGDLFIDASDGSDSSLVLLLEDGWLGGERFHHLTINAAGRLTGHRIEATLDGGPRRVDLRWAGRWYQQRWQGEWIQADIQDEDIGEWTLQQPNRISFDRLKGSWQVQRNCLMQEAARLCVQANGSAEGWRAEARVEALEYQRLATWLPAEVALDGRFDADLTAQADGALPEVLLSVRPTPGTLRYQQDTGEVLQIGFEAGRMQARLQGGVLQAEAGLTLSGQGSVNAALRAAPLDGPGGMTAATLDGEVRGGLQSIGLIAAFLPFADETKGQLDIDLDLAGTLGQPVVTGQLGLTGVSARLPDLGLQLQDLAFKVQGDGGDTLRIDGQARSGPGTLTVIGSMQLDADQGWPLQLAIKGERFQVADIPEARALASPDLALVMAGRDIDLTGTVLLDEADIRLKELPQGAVQVSPDVVVLQSDTTVKDTPWRITTDVAIKMGDKVHFSGFNLATRVAGEVRVRELPGKPTQARGVLTLKDGKYSAYGKKLEISNGRLVFDGPLDNPRVDVRSQRKVDDITAGIQVRGPIRNVEVSLFSSPSMDQGDVLSYLLVGRPMSQASSSEGRVLADAATGLGLSGGEFLAKQIGGAFGLDDVRVDTGSSAEDAALVIGTYLSPKLYVSYGIGLFTPENLLRLRYALTKKLSLQAESGTHSGVDLLYVLEYD